MIRAKMDIVFFKEKNTKNYKCDSILRPSFMVGEGMLFSGQINGKGTNGEYLLGGKYEVSVDFFTINDEAYIHTKHLINLGMTMNIQLASKVIGEAVLKSYIYE